MSPTKSTHALERVDKPWLYRHGKTGAYVVRVAGYCRRRKRRVDDLIDLAPGLSLAEAKRVRDDIHTAFREGRYRMEDWVGAKELSLADFTEELIRERKKLRKAKTVESDHFYARSWTEADIGGMPVAAITFADVNRWASAVLADESIALNTRRRCVQELQKFLGYALDRGLRPSGDNPARGVILPSAVQKAPPVPMTEPQLVAMLEFFRGYDARQCDGAPAKNSHYTGHYPFFTLQWQWGRRAGELCAMKWEDIDTDDLSATFPDTKTNTPIRIPIEPAHLKLLERHKAQLQRHGMPEMRPSVCPLVFPSTSGGVSHTGSRTAKVFQKALRACGLPSHFTAHHLRAQGAIMLAENATERAGRAITGHRTESEWNRYNQATWGERREGMKRNAERLERLLETR